MKNKALKEDDFARKNIAPNDGISKSSFFEKKFGPDWQKNDAEF
jgi:hypothetical protein